MAVAMLAGCGSSKEAAPEASAPAADAKTPAASTTDEKVGQEQINN